MIILQGKNLTKYYVTDLVFKNVDFYIQENEKVALVGPNGAGKSTLFRCIVGEESFDDGQLMQSQKHTLGYLEQMPDFGEKVTLLDAVLEMFNDIFAMRDDLRKLEELMGEAQDEKLEKLLEDYANLTHKYEDLGGFSAESKAKGIIKGLGFSDEDFNRAVYNFSGGEKTRVSLARLLVREPDLLLLDEPTNHLDLEALEWLETFLRNYKGAVFIISHDRYFLDQVVTKVLEMNHHSLKSYSGNYSRYLVLKAEQELAQMRAYEKQQEEIARTEEYIRRYKAGIKSKQARGREKQLSRVERLENVGFNKTININLNHAEQSGDIVLRVKDLAMSYGERVLFKDVNFTIYQGEKIGLIGGNGVGKSTLLKIILGQITPSFGTVEPGARVKISYFDQEHRGLNLQNSVLDEIFYNYDVNLNQARDWLARVLFIGEDVYKTIGDLSGGERARIALLKIIMDEPNFLIMDEPTNHLDIDSKNIVENLLNDFPGTVLVVSHDRYLLDSVCERIFELENGTITDYLGNYSYCREKKAQLERIKREKEEEALKAPKKKAQEKAAPKINKAKVRKEISQMEELIAQKEERLQELSQALSEASSYQDEALGKALVNEYQALEKEIPELYQQWEDLSLLLENM